MDVDDLERIIDLLEGTAVSEFEFEQDGATLRITRGSQQAVAPVITDVQVQPAIVGAAPAIQAAAPAAVDEGLVEVTSPIVGTFYRKPSPDADAFVDVGTRVKEGDTMCIVEAMKLMNEIPSTVSGTVEKILLKDGQVAEYGEILFLVRPD